MKNRDQITHLWLTDEEGKIKIEPTGIKFLYRDDDELSKVECTIELKSEDIFERIMGFLNRYAEENRFEFQAT